MLKGIGKRKDWEESGAAEIIGNILILGITVVLFSTLISFVGMIPTPEQNTYTTFSSSFGGYSSNGTPSYLNITPTGGDELKVDFTSVYVYVNGAGHQLDFSKGMTNISGIWRIGQTLSYPLGEVTFTVNAGDSVRIMIIDETRNQIVWSADQVMGVGEGAPIFKSRWIDSDPNSPGLQSVARADEFTIYATITDPDDDLNPASVYVNLSEFGPGYGAIRMWDNDSDGTFTAVARTPDNIAFGYYTLTFNATDKKGNTATSRYKMAVGGELADYPNLVISAKNIDVSPTNPARGSDSVIVTVRVSNYGKEAATFNLDVEHRFNGGAWRDISEPLTEQHIAGGQSLLLTIPWDSSEVGPSGNHSLRATATVTSLPDDSDYSDNSATTYVTILPKILLVDDDRYNDGSNMDTTRFIGAALQSANFDYTLHTVKLENGPAYSSGENKMSDYDVVIWNTGHSTTPLTSTDENNLISFLTDANGGKKLWMVGEDIVGNVSNNFLNNYLHATPDSMDAAPSGMYYGLSGAFLNNTNFTVTERSGAPNSGDVVNAANGGFALTETGSGEVTSVAYSGAYKVAFFPFDFSSIEFPANQTDVAYKVIKWLASIDFIYGEDLAISQQSISPSNPYYKQDITVTAVVRNNGRVTENTNVEFRIISSKGQITVTTDDFEVAPLTSVEVSTTWEANAVGQVSIIARVDPMNVIKETNELNNQVSSLLSSTSLYIKYRILLVDDDDSGNNGGSNPTDSAQYMADALNYAGIDFERNNVSHNSRYTGPTALDKYNAVIWMTGEANTNTLTTDDRNNLTTFLNAGGSLWLIGQGIENEIGNSQFMSAYMGVDGYSLDTGAGAMIYGSGGENMLHGLRDAVTATFADGTDRITHLTDGTDARAILWADQSLSSTIGVENENSIYGYKTFFMSMDFSFISGTSVNITSTNGTVARAEMAFRVLRGLGMPDSRIELYSTITDLTISNAHPRLGQRYVISANVRNIGGTASAALVRFMDGTHQIGSDSVYVQPGETSTAEVVWTPMYAGQRTIQVLIDPIYEVDEIFRFNDNPSRAINVYFFWDDMENGTSMWSHESTVMLINGENALDYFDRSTQLYTDVVQDWDNSLSVGLQQNTSTYHTYDSCYQLEESGGGETIRKADAIVGIVIDNSPSMRDRYNSSGVTWQNVAKEAAKQIIDGLSDNSVVGVYAFGGSGPITVKDMTQLANGGRDDVLNAIDSLPDGQMSPIWDTIGKAYTEVNTTAPSYPSLTPSVVALSDGADYKSADNSAYKDSKLEAGSKDWAPWGNMEPENGIPTKNYPDHWGKYWYYKNSLPGEWVDAGTHGGSYSSTRKGLVHSDIPIYTVGLGLEHYSPPNASGIATHPAEGKKDQNTHINDTESGTTEYNLWRIATTSGAEYHYTDNPDDLGNIFQIIVNDIVSGSNQTRADFHGNTISAVNDENCNKSAITPAFNLRHTSSAVLTFWHKYNIVPGVNGAFLEVGYDDGSGMKYRYISPTVGSYTGSMYTGADRTDDRGNSIMWAWNGASKGGSFGWEFVKVNLLNYIPEDGLANVRVKFNYTQYGGGTGYGWYIDDVTLKVSRENSYSPDSSCKDVWQLQSGDAHSGTHAWWNGDPTDSGKMMPGIDNSLISAPIDLTRARNASLSAYLKFNINNESGAPPDGFRIEVTKDNGVTWQAINLGARAAWGVSGSNNTGTTSYTGHDTGGNWIEVSSLTRVIVDLSDWSGNVIQIRFRVVDTNGSNYAHYKDSSAGFGGFYVDDVMVRGETLTT